jgi:hypothetical protein
MSLVDTVFSYGRLVRMIQSYVPLMLFYPDVHGTAHGVTTQKTPFFITVFKRL